MAHGNDAYRSRETWVGFVVGALAILGVPLVVGIALDVVDPPQKEPDRQIKAAADIMAIKEALELSRQQQGRFPTADEGLSSLVPRQLDRLPVDPWGNGYIYTTNDGNARVLTYGSDGQPGGDGAASDVTSDDPMAAVRAHRRHLIPTPLGMALVIGSGIVLPVIAFRARRRSGWAPGILVGAASFLGGSCLWLSAPMLMRHDSYAWVPLAIGLSFLCGAVGVVARWRYSDSVVLSGIVLFGVSLWVLSGMIAR